MTELVNTLVTALGQNAANVTPAIPPRIPLVNAEGEEVPPPQEDRDAMVNEARTNTNVRRRRTRRRRHNATRGRYENQETTPKSHGTERTRDLVFNRLERMVINANLDDEYDSEYECLAGFRESADPRAWLDAQRAQC